MRISGLANCSGRARHGGRHGEHAGHHGCQRRDRLAGSECHHIRVRDDGSFGDGANDYLGEMVLKRLIVAGDGFGVGGSLTFGVHKAHSLFAGPGLKGGALRCPGLRPVGVKRNGPGFRRRGRLQFIQRARADQRFPTLQDLLRRNNLDR